MTCVERKSPHSKGSTRTDTRLDFNSVVFLGFRFKNITRTDPVFLDNTRNSNRHRDISSVLTERRYTTVIQILKWTINGSNGGYDQPIGLGDC